MDIVCQEYERDNKLKKLDVENLLKWVGSQPHLPEITEQQGLWFLQSCYYSNEAAKLAIDKYFTIRTKEREIFNYRTSEEIKEVTETSMINVLSQKTQKAETVILSCLLDTDPKHFNFVGSLNLVDSIFHLSLKLDGTHKGTRFIVDMKNSSIGHVTRLDINILAIMLFYLQNAVPMRLKGVHFINIKPFMDMLLTMCKPFLKKELLEIIHFHKSIEELYEYIHQDCLPSDYGGKSGSKATLKDELVSKLLDNRDFFEFQNTQLIEENKRPEKSKFSETFGVDGTFKKLELD